MSVLKVPLDPATVVVAVDPGKVMNRVWVSDGTGWLERPVSVPVSCAGVEQVQQLLTAHPSAVAPVIAVEATGSLHQAFVADLERRLPGSTRLFAPSETKAARTQLGSGRFKTDDRDCAALTYLARHAPAAHTLRSRRSTRSVQRCDTAADSSATAKSPSSVCMTSSMPYARGSLPRPGTGGCWRSRPRRARRSCRPRSRSRAARRR